MAITHTFNQNYNQDSQTQKQSYIELTNEFNDIQLTDEQQRYLLWLANYPEETKVFTDMFHMLRTK